MDLITAEFYEVWAGQAAVSAAATSSARPRLKMLIPVASRQIQRFLGRPIQKVEREQLFSLEPYEATVWLPAFPVAEVASVHRSGTGTWDAASEVDPADYQLASRTGRLRLLRSGATGSDVLRVVYTGGLVEDRDALLAETDGELTHPYRDLAVACAHQVHEMMVRRNSLGANNEAAGRGAVTYGGPMELLPYVQTLLEPLRARGVS